MPRTAHRLKDFLTAPILDPGLIDTFDSSDSLLPYRPEPLPGLIKVEPEITEISVEFGPGFVIEAEGPFDPPWYEDTAEGKNKPVKKEPEPEPEKETEKETQEETGSDWSNVSRQKADRQNFEVDPSTPAEPTVPGPTLSPDTITEARSGGGGLLLLALAALLGD